jgi:hypothetical protein
MPRFYITVHYGASDSQVVDPGVKLLIDFENIELARKWASDLESKIRVYS